VNQDWSEMVCVVLVMPWKRLLGTVSATLEGLQKTENRVNNSWGFISLPEQDLDRITPE